MPRDAPAVPRGECTTRQKTEMENRLCLRCGNSFSPTSSSNRYCRLCAFKHSEEAKKERDKKAREAKKGKEVYDSVGAEERVHKAIEWLAEWQSNNLTVQNFNNGVRL